MSALRKPSPNSTVPGNKWAEFVSVYTVPNKKCDTQTKSTGHSLRECRSPPPTLPDSEVAANSWLWIFVPVESKAPFTQLFFLQRLPPSLSSECLAYLFLCHCFAFALSNKVTITLILMIPNVIYFVYTYHQFTLLLSPLCSPCPFLFLFVLVVFNTTSLLLI